MVRKQVFITADQNRLLKRRAGETGMAEAEIVRRGIDLALSNVQPADADWRSELDEFVREAGEFEDLAARVQANKRGQADKWRKRLAGTRRKLADL